MRVPTYEKQVQERGIPSVNQRGNFSAQDFGAGQGRAIADLGNSIADAWETKVKADGEALAFEAMSRADLENTKRFMDMQNNAKPGGDGFADTFIQEHDTYFDQLIGETENPYARRKLEEHKMRSRESYGTQALMFQAKEGVRYRSQKITEAADNEAKMLMDMAPDMAEQYLSSSVERSDALIDAQPMPPEQKEELKQRTRAARAEAAWQAKLQNPMELLNPKPFVGGFDEAIDIVLKNEGGYVAVDGASGAPANFGINQKANPDVNVKDLTADKAKELYKERYWDKFGMDEVPKDAQVVVFDGVVNHRQDFGRELVNAAKAGATPQELAAMRRKEYQRLATEAPEKYGKDLKGWMNRMDKVESATGLGTIGKYMTADQQSKALDQIARLKEKDAEEFKKDIPEWGRKRGLSTEQIVGAQVERGVEPFYAKVVSKDEAKAYAEKLNQADTPEQVIKVAGEIQDRYQGYSSNAIRDLMAEGVKGEQVAALDLAMQGYGEHVTLLSQVGKTDKTTGETFDERFKKRGFVVKDVEEKVISELEDYLRAKTIEDGDGGVASDMLRASVVNLARAKMMQGQEVSINDAVQFAIKPIVENYKVTSVNGTELRLPAKDADDIAEALNFSNGEVVKRIAAAYPEKDMRYANNAIPILNEDKDGVIYLSPESMTPLVDKDGVIGMSFEMAKAMRETSKAKVAEQPSKPMTKEQRRQQEKQMIDIFGRE